MTVSGMDSSRPAKARVIAMIEVLASSIEWEAGEARRLSQLFSARLGRPRAAFCKRAGHPRTPENVGAGGSCLPCKRQWRNAHAQTVTDPRFAQFRGRVQSRPATADEIAIAGEWYGYLADIEIPSDALAWETAEEVRVEASVLVRRQ